MRRMSPSLYGLLSLLLCTLPARAPAADASLARERVRAAAEAMGGEARLRGLSTLHLQGIGHRLLLEQSERPEGPWAVLYEQREEWRDVKGGRSREEVEVRSGAVGAGIWTRRPSVVVADGTVAVVDPGKAMPGRPAQKQEAELRMALAPERVLLLALDAEDLRTGRDEVLQGVPHHTVGFRWEGRPVRLLLNARTHLPTAVEATMAFPADLFWSPWGDVAVRTLYSQWMLVPGGLCYPYQWDEERNGQPYRSFNLTALEVDVTPPTDAFSLSPEVREAFAAQAGTTVETLPLGQPDRPAVEVAEGVVQMQGMWNVALVRQEDGVVVLEGPISSGYSAKVLEEAARRFPGMRVKAVVSTSDAWPHIGGLREYVARGVPVYVLDLNRPIIERLLAAPRSQAPDALARTPRRAQLKVVSGRMVLGNGANRMVLAPVRGEGSERMMLVALPGRKLLYGSDLVQQTAPGRFFMPQYLSELAGAAARERLEVERVFAMHLGPTPWTDVLSAVTEAERVATPAPQ